MRNPLDRIKAEQAERASQGAAARLNPLDRIDVGPGPGADAAATGGILRHFQDLVDLSEKEMSPLPAMGEERMTYKRDVALPRILDFVEAYQAAGETYPNSVAVKACIWLFDVGEIERGLSLGLALAAGGNQIMPPRFERRDIETFLCDALYDWANRKWKGRESASPYLERLIEAVEAGPWALHPAVHSKLYAMAAKHAELQGDSAAVIAWCEKAMAVNPAGHGTKTLMAAARAKQASQAAAAA